MAALKRAVRTFLQAFVATLAVLAVPALSDLVRAISSSESYELDFRFWQGVLIAASLAGAISLISWAQNALEDAGRVPMLMKD